MVYESLRRQGYHIIGRHSAVKTCLWLRKSIRDEGECYKSKFYGISSHRCVQMTPSIKCNQACIHCWREHLDLSKGFPVREWDDPEEIVEGCIREQMRLISGYKGSMETDIKKIEEAKKPKHVAISLIGEPTLYPFLPELISAFHKRGMTTFLVTNGTFPEALEDVDPSQLYLSLNAPDEETYKRVCNANHWERIKRSLFMLKDKNRTAIRITLIEGMNIKEPESYGKLIEMVEPVFIEVKAYMHLGFSRERLSRGAMPPHDRVRGFAIELASLINYEIADESEISRVVLLSRDGKINPIIA